MCGKYAGAVARTSTVALNNATLPYIVELANNGYQKALQNNPHLLNGLNVYRGHVTCKSVAQALDLPYVSAASILA